MSVGVKNHRALELLIRVAVAEERLLQRRLDRLAGEQQRARWRIEQELRREHFGRLPDGWNGGNGSG
jgi:hypothetical protein